MRPSLKMVVPAAAVALIAAAPSLAATGTHRAHVARPSAALHGSVQPAVAHSAQIGKAVPATPVRVSFVLRPVHSGLLRTMAAHSSGGTALTQGQIDRLFGPPADTRTRIAAYMRTRGFRPLGRGLLTMSFSGNVAQAQRAFGVQLARYRLNDGTAYRAPAGAIHLPPALAADVISGVGALDAAADAAGRPAAGGHDSSSRTSPSATAPTPTRPRDPTPAASSPTTWPGPTATTRRPC